MDTVNGVNGGSSTSDELVLRSTKAINFEEQLDVFRDLEAQKFYLLKNLHEENQRLRDENEALTQKVDNLSSPVPASDGNDLVQYKMQLERTERQLRDVQASTEASSFVLVLIDGNAHQFHDSFLDAGANGGANAAMELREEIRNHIARSGGSKDWGVIVRFYLDLHHGVRSGGRRKPDIADCVRQFVGGFNQSVLLFDLIDTGHGAEVSLFKMKEAFNLFIDNVQCKHIYFGCALKPESVSILSEYQFNPIIADSITLLQSSPPEPATYKPPFDIVQFRKIFKSSEDGLGDGQTGWDSIQERGQANVSPAMSISNDFSGNQDAALEGWARSAHDQAKSGLTTPTPRHDPRFSRPHAYAREPIGSWHANSKTIWLNINNERVDPELGKIDQGAYDQLKTRAQNTTLCGWYHLTGHCSSSVCEYAHGPRLPPALADALRQRVRAWTPCRNGSACRQVNCIYGHMCPEADCTKGHACRYAKLHGKDRTAVRPWEGRKVRNDEYPTQPRRLVEPSVKDSTASPPKGHKELGAHFDVASKDLTGTDRDTEFITINQPSRGGQGPLFDHYSHTAEAHACENLFDEPENQEPDQGSGKTEEEDEVPLPKYEHIRMFQKRGSNNP